MLINVISIDPDNTTHWTSPQYLQVAKRSREQRLLSVCKQSKDYGLEIRFWEGVTSENSTRANINLAHRRIVADAKQRGLSSVCIAEDDMIIVPGGWEYYLQNIPEDYDLYLSGIYDGKIENGRIMNGFSGLTLYIVNNRFYDFFLSINPSDHIDRSLGNFAFEKKYVIVSPFIARQMSEGYSDNHRKMVSHEAYIKEMKFFGDPA